MFNFTDIHRYELFPKKLSQNERLIISEKFPFYNRLSSTNKRCFEHRVSRFKENHNFVSRSQIVITDEIMLSISAIAIKLTFGYRRYLFSRVDTIIVYPKDYFSQLGNQQHKGETSPRFKTVVFSWKDFEEGIKIENDNLNLGLHEFTHAMHFSMLSENSYSSSYFKRNYQNLLSFLESKEEQKRVVDSGYLREYAYENQFEFLAVLVEHFFESPIEFQQKLPEVYRFVKKILNIDFEELFIR